MKKLLAVLLFCSVAGTGIYSQSSADIRNSTDWTWFGIDYTNCYYLMSYDFPSVADLESKISAWNDVVILEKEKSY